MKKIKRRLLGTLALAYCLAAGSAVAATSGLTIANSGGDELVFYVNFKQAFDMYSRDIKTISGDEMDHFCNPQFDPCTVKAYKKTDGVYVGGLDIYNEGKSVAIYAGDADYSGSIKVGETMNRWILVPSNMKK